MSVNAAYYLFSQWYQDDSYKLNLQTLLNIPLECNLVHYEKADIVFIAYGGNADHIPFIEQLLQEHQKKQFVFIVGEYLRRVQSLLAKKVSTKASGAMWARALFPVAYPLAHQLMPRPSLAEDTKLYHCLLKYRDSPRVHMVLCEDAPELGQNAYNYPIFIRDFISHFVPKTMLIDTKHSSTERTALISHKLQNALGNYTASRNLSDRAIVCSTIFGNTTLERVRACAAISKYRRVQVYGKNPITNFGRLEGNSDTVYSDSQFILCFENVSADGYITEKLFNALRNQAIPIYWGAKNIEKYCNPESIILCKSNKDIRNLHSRIKNMSAEALAHIQNSPYFLPHHIEFFLQSYENVRARISAIIQSI